MRWAWVVAALLPACSGGVVPPSTADTPRVYIERREGREVASPALARIAVLRPIRWADRTHVEHRIVFRGGRDPLPTFRLGAYGGAYVLPQHTGTFTYTCALHPDLHGVVVVHE